MGRSQQLRAMLTTDLDVSADSRNGSSAVPSDAPQLLGLHAAPLMDLDFGALLKVGLSQNHLSKVAFAIGGVLTFQGVAWEVVEELWSRVPSIWRTVLLLVSPLLLVSSPILIALASVLISVVTSVLRHCPRLTEEGSKAHRSAAIHLSQGLLNRQAMQIPVHKVQSVTWESTWIRRLFAMDTVHIRQAAAGGAVSGNNGDGAGGMGGGAIKWAFQPWTQGARAARGAVVFGVATKTIGDSAPREICLLGALGPEDIGPVALCFGRGLVDGAGWGAPWPCSLGMERMVVEQSVPGKMATTDGRP